MNTSEHVKKLALGTVQFGLPYGVANQCGQVTKDEAHAILALAREKGIRTLDTAIAYGASETVLGSESLDDFDIITKLPSIPDGCKDIAGWLDRELDGSLRRLNVSKVDGFLIHHSSQLVGHFGKTIYNALMTKKNEGTVNSIGVSIYSPDELSLLSERYQFDLIQAPLNIVDTRLQDTGWLKRLEQSGTRLHVRSVFMQGLLLMPAVSRPAKFSRWASHWALWEQWLSEVGLTPLQACIRYALSIPQIEKVVVGVDSVTQLNDIIAASDGVCPEPPVGLKCSDIKLLNPSHWNRL